MKTEEWTTLVKALKSVYTSPNFLPDEWSVKLWYSMLKDIPYEVLNIGIQRYIGTNRYPPTIADLRASISPKEQDWSEAWEEVKRAVRMYGSYNEAKALESMSPFTREIVERLGFREICLTENEDVYRANFRMAYEQGAKKRDETASLPGTLQARLNTVLQIGDGE